MRVKTCGLFEGYIWTLPPLITKGRRAVIKGGSPIYQMTSAEGESNQAIVM